MGNAQSFDASHVRIYQKLLHISSPQTRAQMIQTLLAGTEYVQSAKNAGIYSHLLNYMARVNAREPIPLLPGEQTLKELQERGAAPAVVRAPVTNTIITAKPNETTPVARVTKGRGNEKALSYFQSCLMVLGLEEEVALTEDSLRSAYKKAALKAHPDKGGSEQQFEAVTKSFAYLTEILKRINGGRSTAGVVDAPTALKDSRQTDSKDWSMVEPVRLNPKKLDINVFNQMFEQTRIPDPDDEGYGDWLKKEGDVAKSGPNFSGKFNRDVFNQAFNDEVRSRAGTALTVTVPQAMTLAPSQGVELGRGATGDYTAPANAQMKYTDLRNAYTTESAFTHQVSNVNVEARSFDSYSGSRKKTPEPLSDREMQAIQEAEAFQAKKEKERSIRAAEELSMADKYFARMKQLVLTEGTGGKKNNRG
jgi:curved DNA-binding protein CbpA